MDKFIVAELIRKMVVLEGGHPANGEEWVQYHEQLQQALVVDHLALKEFNGLFRGAMGKGPANPTPRQQYEASLAERALRAKIESDKKFMEVADKAVKAGKPIPIKKQLKKEEGDQASGVDDDVVAVGPVCSTLSFGWPDSDGSLVPETQDWRAKRMFYWGLLGQSLVNQRWAFISVEQGDVFSVFEKIHRHVSGSKGGQMVKLLHQFLALKVDEATVPEFIAQVASLRGKLRDVEELPNLAIGTELIKEIVLQVVEAAVGRPFTSETHAARTNKAATLDVLMGAMGERTRPSGATALSGIEVNAAWIARKSKAGAARGGGEGEGPRGGKGGGSAHCFNMRDYGECRRGDECGHRLLVGVV